MFFFLYVLKCLIVSLHELFFYKNQILIEGPPFILLEEGIYVISDPTNVATMGYIDPETKEAYKRSYQPYAANLAKAMEDSAVRGGSKKTSFDIKAFHEHDKKFYNEFMKDNYPQRSKGNY